MTKSTTNGPTTIFGLADEQYSADCYNVNVRAHRPKGQPAQQLIDISMRLTLQVKQLAMSSLFADLYEAPPADMIEFAPNDVVAREPDMIRYNQTTKEYNVIVNGQTVQCAHGMTLVDVHLNEKKDVTNPPVVLTVCCKGLDQMAGSAEWLLNKKQVRFVAKTAAELTTQQPAEAAAAAPKRRGRAKKATPTNDQAEGH